MSGTTAKAPDFCKVCAGQIYRWLQYASIASGCVVAALIGRAILNNVDVIGQAVKDRGFEFAKVLFEHQLNWPVALVLGLFLFRGPISAVIMRFEHLTVKTPNMTAELRGKVEQQQASEAAPRVTSFSYKSPEPNDSSPKTFAAFAKRKALITNEFEKIASDNPKAATEVLIDQLAAARLLYIAELVYRTIYGSQITILRKLRGQDLADQNVVTAQYTLAKIKSPEFYREYPLEQYLGYMINFGLVETPSTSTIAITIDGEAFLEWIDHNKLSDDKPF